MHRHPHLRLTQMGRLRRVIQHLEHGRSLSELVGSAFTSAAARRAAQVTNVVRHKFGPAEATAVIDQARPSAAS